MTHLTSKSQVRADTLAAASLALNSLRSSADAINVPILKGLCSLAIQAVETCQLVKTNKDACKLLSHRICELTLAIINQQEHARTSIPLDMARNITQLSSTLGDIHHFMSQKLKQSYIIAILRSADDNAAIRRYEEDIKHAIALFGIQSHIGTRQAIVQWEKRVSERLVLVQKVNNTSISSRASWSNTLSDSAGTPHPKVHNVSTIVDDSDELHCHTNSLNAEPLPPSPKVFYGRHQSVSNIIASITQTEAQYIAILGPGGIGKSSVALAVLHNPEVERLYGAMNRFFIPCDAATSRDSLIGIIAMYFGISGPRIQERLVRLLSESVSRSLVVLDNFETPWEPAQSRAEVEVFLGVLAQIPSLSLIMTMRGAERPQGIAWSRPFLPPLEPLDHKSARQTFLAISDISGNDANLDCLIGLLDNLPLGIVLMANLAQVESTDTLLQRWTDERTSMLARAAEDRLSSLDMSIRVSLQSPRMREFPQAEVLLSVLCLLPDGVLSSELPLIFPDIPTPGKAGAVLKQTALAYEDGNSRLRVLAPVRGFMEPNCAPSPIIFRGPLYYHLALSDLAKDVGVTEQSATIIRNLMPHIGNIQSIFTYALHRGVEVVRVIEGTIALSPLLEFTGLGSLDNLRLGAKVAGDIDLNLHAECSMLLIPLLSRREGYLSTSIADLERTTLVFRQTGNSVGEAKSLTLLAHMVSQERGDKRRACELLTQALSLWDRHPEQQIQRARSQRRMSEILFSAGKKPESVILLDEALQSALHSGDIYTAAHCYQEHGRRWAAECAWEESERDTRRAMNLFLKIGFEEGRGNCLMGLGMIYHERCMFESAASVHSSAVSIYVNLGLPEHAAYSRMHLAKAFIALRKLEEAKVAVHEAGRVLIALRNLNGQAYTNSLLGSIAQKSHDYREAEIRYQECLSATRRRRRMLQLGAASQGLADVYFARACFDDAMTGYVATTLYNRDLRSKSGVVSGLRRIGDTFAVLGETGTAICTYQAILPSALKIQSSGEVAACLCGLAGLALRRGKPDKARGLFESAVDLFRIVGQIEEADRCLRCLDDIGIKCSTGGV